ncbi:hypothetical protein OU787_30990 [Kitasatospora sp. YST-16]|uniref:hypothetical protein n=1 Tax=Kitasatospora sp. YST-16 TaxID=2998080 RepID=UPI00228504CE|nr:hypothetical protein [Kitasatospora sp. YST-16]WAL75568.1 hypothetical protein OU787_30990 [Kitasatospora sp. YST-16]WNW41634.1 hypothetical protein RKE32_30940 [Streptomyces sp. Li-HN-5-13]
MTAVVPSSMFAAVARYFANPRAQEDVRLTVPSTGVGGHPLSLTPDDALAALYGPDPEPELTTQIWQAAVLSAATDPGSMGSHQLLLIWLMLPRLSRTSYRICRRLRADRADIEAEMVLSILAELRTADPGALPLAENLLKAARSNAWRLARTGLKETPCTFLENLGDDSRLTPHEEPEPPEQQNGTEVEISRPDGPDGLRTPLRFTFPADRLGREAFRRLTSGAVLRENQHQHRVPRAASVVTTPARRTGRHR